MEYEDVWVCKCGAITIRIEGEAYSMMPETFRKLFGEDDPETDNPIMCACNRCVNNWAVDLCACGSGETPEECKEGHEICGMPMQDIEEARTHVNGGWAFAQ